MEAVERTNVSDYQGISKALVFDNLFDPSDRSGSHAEALYIPWLDSQTKSVCKKLKRYVELDRDAQYRGLMDIVARQYS